MTISIFSANENCYAKCRHSESTYNLNIMRSVIMLNIVMLGVVALYIQL
jgi:hypothetical protein